MANLKCSKCGYLWTCKSKLRVVNCPSCRKSVFNEIYLESEGSQDGVKNE